MIDSPFVYHHIFSSLIATYSKLNLCLLVPVVKVKRTWNLSLLTTVVAKCNSSCHATCHVSPVVSQVRRCWEILAPTALISNQGPYRPEWETLDLKRRKRKEKYNYILVFRILLAIFPNEITLINLWRTTIMAMVLFLLCRTNYSNKVNPFSLKEQKSRRLLKNNFQIKTHLYHISKLSHMRVPARFWASHSIYYMLRITVQVIFIIGFSRPDAPFSC